MGGVETWRPISGYIGQYEVSDRGRIRSIIARTGNQSGIFERGAICHLKATTDKHGYMRVTLAGKKTKLVHRLVGAAFIPNPLNKPSINHKNSRPTDNRAANLEWATYAEQQRHSYNRGLRRPWCTKLTDADVREIRLRLSQTPQPTYCSLGVEFDVQPGMISKIHRGKAHRFVK